MATASSRLNTFQQALLPAAQPVEAKACCDALAAGGRPFLDLILAQDLGPLWHHCLQAGGLLVTLPSHAVEALHEARIAATAGYLAQRAALLRIDELFESAGIPYVVMKGGHVRECVYPEPSVRSCSDLDILVERTDRQRAARLLVDAGYGAHVEPATISHEATFSRPPVDIDLHWDILRPGRTRIDVTAEFLARRQRVNGFWGLSDGDTLFLMLTHPAFAKYVCSPNMGLARVADFLLWVQTRPVEWTSALKLLEQAGLKTAAWTMLSWFRMLAAPQSIARIEGWLDTVKPGRLRAAYLEYWLMHDLPSRWLNRPLPIQIGFTLFMHDRVTDAQHAIKGWWQARRNAHKDTRLLLGGEYGLHEQAR